MGHSLFLSYRRADVPGYVGRLADVLESAFCGHVFRDVDGIPPGADWQQELTRRVRQSEVMLVLIGSKWKEIWISKRGERDYVREEITLAKTLNVPVIPVLLGDAQMPSKDVLDDYSWLSDIQTYSIRDEQRRWSSDTKGLVEHISRMSGLPLLDQSESLSSSVLWDKKWWIGAIAVPVLIAAVTIYFTMSDKPTHPTNNDPVTQSMEVVGKKHIGKQSVDVAGSGEIRQTAKIGGESHHLEQEVNESD